MNPYRHSRGPLAGLLCLSVLALLAHSFAPGPASAISIPPDIEKEVIPGDPGTPYEEPEADPTGPTDPKPPEGIIGGSGGPPVVAPDTIGPPTRRSVDRRWLLPSLRAWQIQLRILLRF